jgi:hypothetical protein
MNAFKWLLVAIAALMVISIGSVFYFGLFDINSVYGVFTIIIAYIAGYIYLKMAFDKDGEEENTVKTLDYCWLKASEVLRKMPGGVSMEWRMGAGRRSELRYFYDGQKKYGFRALFGFATDTRQQVVVIFDMEHDDIARFYSNPSVEVLTDPFKDFKPFYNPATENMMRMASMMGRGKKGRRLKFDFGGMYGGESNNMPSDDSVNRGLGGGEN